MAPPVPLPDPQPELPAPQPSWSLPSLRVGGVKPTVTAEILALDGTKPSVGGFADAETEAAAIKIQAMHRGTAARKQASEGVPPEEGEEAQVEVAPLVRRRRYCARLLTCRACLTRHSCWCSLL